MPEITISIPDNTPPDQIEGAIAAQTAAYVNGLKEKAAKEQRIAGLYAEVSKLTGEKFNNTDALIERLLPFASSRLRKRLGGVAAPAAGRRKRAKVDDALVAQVKALIASGMSKLAISREVGLSYPSVLKIAKS